MNALLSINYFVWLIISALFFATGEFLSKKFALNPSSMYVVYILLSYSAGVLTWLPAILQKNQLSVVGTIWSVLSLLTTITIGVLIFNEKINFRIGLGILFAIVSIALLSWE